jgi:putative drug exporter of the RND superfamily
MASPPAAASSSEVEQVFAAWGRFVYRRRWFVAGVSVLGFAGLGLLAANGGQLHASDSITTEAARADGLAGSVLPRQPDRATFVLVFSSRSQTASDRGFRSAMEAALAPLGRDPQVFSIVTPYRGGDASLVSRTGHSASAVVTLKQGPDRGEGDYPRLRALVHSRQLSVLATGPLAAESDFNRLLDEGLARAEHVAVPLSLLVLVVAFGGVLAGVLPVGLGVMAITSATGVTFLIARRWGVDPGATELIGLLGLGLAIDYSLFVVSRFREELTRTADVATALAATTATASRSITFSALTVMAGLSGLFFFRGTWLGTVVVPMIAVVAFAVAFNLTFLTAVLALLGGRINWLTLPLPRLAEPGTTWRRIAAAVLRRPLLFLAPALALIAVVAAPLLQIHLATDHLAVIPAGTESRRGAEVISSQFPNQGLSSHVMVVDFGSGDAGAPGHSLDVARLRERVSRLPGVASVRGPAVGPHVAVISVQSSAPERSDGARHLVALLRAQGVTGGLVLVGGSTAGDMDRTDAILGRAPAAAAAMGLATYLILLLLLGSVVLPLKAVLTNLLSMTASFGAVVWIFQEGHLSNLLDFTPAATDPTLPVLMFCLLFGLSMDYEVFLLTRMQEEYRRTGDSASAVVHGVQRSARLVTFAAVIMVVVFGAFALSDVVIFKTAGIGASIAVLVDATLVRGVIVPAAMALLGGANWWAPRWLGPIAGRWSETHRAEPPAAIRAA